MVIHSGGKFTYPNSMISGAKLQGLAPLGLDVWFRHGSKWEDPGWGEAARKELLKVWVVRWTKVDDPMWEPPQWGWETFNWVYEPELEEEGEAEKHRQISLTSSSIGHCLWIEGVWTWMQSLAILRSLWWQKGLSVETPTCGSMGGGLGVEFPLVDLLLHTAEEVGKIVVYARKMFH